MVPKFMHFEIGSSVEVSIDDGGGIWLSATVVSHVDSNRMLVNCHDFDMRAVVSHHQLRPFSPPESNRELKAGDIVKAFHHGLWWNGSVREDLGDGRLVVSLNDGEMAFPKKLLRPCQDWINQNHVSTITNNDNNNKDIISELSNDVLLHIMDFMDTKDAVKTSVLCKRWKSVSKKLTNLTFSPSTHVLMEYGYGIFKNFASWVLFSRDHSCSINNLSIECWADPTLLDGVIRYALSCNLQHLRLYECSFFPSFSLIFCSSSLTSLKLCTSFYAMLPKSLHLPALKTMHLEWVKFSLSDDNISVEPFSNCHVLTTLFLAYCFVPGDAQILCISNSTLSSLTILAVQDCQITLSTPNLSSFSILGSISHHLLSTCHLSFLQQVNIDQYLDGIWDDKISIIMEWLQVLANLKELTVYPIAFQTILYELSKPMSTRRQPPRFTRLKSLKVFGLSFLYTSHILNGLVVYLLQNSSMTTIDIITV